MNKGDRVMVVANHAIRENNCGMATLVSYVKTDPDKFGGYCVETWEVRFDDGVIMRCNILVDDGLVTIFE